MIRTKLKGASDTCHSHLSYLCLKWSLKQSFCTNRMIISIYFVIVFLKTIASNCYLFI